MGGKITLAIRRRFGYNSKVSSAGVMELVDVVDSKSTAGDSVPVRVRSPAPRRSKRHIVCSDFFTKVRARSRRCSSFPNRTRCRWASGPPLRGGFVLLQENIGRNQPFHIVFSPSEYIPSVDEHKSSGAGTIKCRTARNRWEGVRFFWTVSHTDVSLKGVVPDGRKKQAYPACAHCQERMK